MKPAYIFLIMAGVIASGCMGPIAKLRKAKRLIREAELSGLEWKSDTVFQDVKVTVPEIHFDTVVRRVDFRDTIIVTKEKAVTRVKINTVTRDVFVETKCPEKIVVKKVPYTVTREIKVGYSLMGVVWRCAVSSLILAAIVFGLCKLRII
jgi:hypothetical protein